MKIVFFGTPEFAVGTLREIHEKTDHEIAAVVTAPDKPAGRGHAPKMSDVKIYAIENNLELLQPERLKNEDFIEKLRSINADVFVVVAFRMLPEIVWGMPPKGTFNVHASLLPRYRGAAPINWAIINGETHTGVTTFMLSHDIDTGPVLFQTRLEIGEDENVGSVYDRLMEAGAKLAVETLKGLETGSSLAVPQNELEGEVCGAPKLNPENCTIDWNKKAEEIHNLVRGLSPYPGARTQIKFENGDISSAKILKTRVASEAVETPQKRLWVKCGDGNFLEILELQAAGKKRMKAEDYARGLHGQIEFE